MNILKTLYYWLIPTREHTLLFNGYKKVISIYHPDYITIVGKGKNYDWYQNQSGRTYTIFARPGDLLEIKKDGVTSYTKIDY